MLESGVKLKITQTECGEMMINENVLSLQQTQVVKHDGNIVVSASAGTGKTRTMVAKIMYDLERNTTHKVVAAITFTIKAAQEIRDRLTVDGARNFIGTNNSFAIEEIIQPFMKDVYGEHFDKDFDTDYNGERGFTVDCGIEYVKSTGILGKCQLKNSCDNHPKHIEKYHNFIFDLALNIVKQSNACRLFLQSKYFGIYIDEYQDCDSEMHEFFMYLCNDLGICTFVVGDDKQSIYSWRGAKRELFDAIIKNTSFQHFVLTENHRSHKQIQDFSNLFFEQTRVLVRDPKNHKNIMWIESTNDEWAEIVVDLLDVTKTSALLRSQKENSKAQEPKQGAIPGSYLLTDSGMEHIFIPDVPIRNITTKSAWLYFAIARYVLLDNYSIHSFLQDIPSAVSDDKKVVVKIKNFLEEIKRSTSTSDNCLFDNEVRKLSDYLGCAVIDECLKKLYDTVSDTKYAVSLSGDNPIHCAMTLHSSKGLEFDQVIVFTEDYAHNQKMEIKHRNNFYVACTRAISKLIIVDTNHRDTVAVCKEIKHMFDSQNIDIEDLITLHE